MGDEQDPKFMKPGDDPVLDHALNELRFDSGLYQPGEYDMFGRRRAMGPGAKAPSGAAEGPESKPAAAPVVTQAPPEGRKKMWAGVLAVVAAVGPVIVYATVWKPREAPAARAIASVGVEASAAPVVTSAAPMAIGTATAAPTASSAAPAPSVNASAAPSATTSAALRPPAGAAVKPTPRATAEDPYDVAPKAPRATPSAAPSAPPTAAPSATSPHAPAATPPSPASAPAPWFTP
jgi:hypothetical protein